MALVKRDSPEQRPRRVERDAIASSTAQSFFRGMQQVRGQSAALRRSPHRHAAQMSFTVCAGFVTDRPNDRPGDFSDEDRHALHSPPRGINREHGVGKSAGRVLRTIRFKRFGEALTDRERVTISRTSDSHQLK